MADEQPKSDELYNNEFISRYVSLHVCIYTAHTFVYDQIRRIRKPQISSSSERSSSKLPNLCCICWKADDFHIILVYNCVYICGPFKRKGLPGEVTQLSAGFTAFAKKNMDSKQCKTH